MCTSAIMPALQLLQDGNDAAAVARMVSGQLNKMRRFSTVTGCPEQTDETCGCTIRETFQVWSPGAAAGAEIPVRRLARRARWRMLRLYRPLRARARLGVSAVLAPTYECARGRWRGHGARCGPRGPRRRNRGLVPLGWRHNGRGGGAWEPAAHANWEPRWRSRRKSRPKIDRPGMHDARLRQRTLSEAELLGICLLIEETRLETSLV